MSLSQEYTRIICFSSARSERLERVEEADEMGGRDGLFREGGFNGMNVVALMSVRSLNFSHRAHHACVYVCLCVYVCMCVCVLGVYDMYMSICKYVCVCLR